MSPAFVLALDVYAGRVAAVPLKCITLAISVAPTRTFVTLPLWVVTLTVTPLLVLVTVDAAIASIRESAICSTVLPFTVSDVAETVVAVNVAVFVTLRFVNVPVVAVTVEQSMSSADTDFVTAVALYVGNAFACAVSFPVVASLVIAVM